MELLDNVEYNKLTTLGYRKKIQELLKNEKLINLGLKYEINGFTEYNYPFETITIGNGEKDIFIVGGTHGSEVISVDFILQLIKSIPDFIEFDSNTYKLIIVPLQNPEGFDVSTSTYAKIDNSEFKNKSYEYYKKYRIDSLISIAFESLNKLINNFLNKDEILDANLLLNQLKEFINTNKNWARLSEDKAIPEISILNNYINNINKVNDFNELRNLLINICNNIDDSLLDEKDNFKLFINEFKKGFNNSLLWNSIDNKNKQKLYQLMFKDDRFENIDNELLKKQVSYLYEIYKHPYGSQIAYDANGNGVNLNANSKLNHGIDILKSKNNNIYGEGSRDNIVRYFKGPIGAPTKNINDFTYEKENIYLYNMIKYSYDNGRYLSTFLYHGTGGMIYFKPSNQLMEEKEYEEYLLYNKTLASIYSLSNDYKMLDSSGTTGYGNYLRKTFPGVLLIELSKMGGNPIGPYGDKSNIYKTMNDNMNAIKNILAYYNKILKNNKHK